MALTNLQVRITFTPATNPAQTTIFGDVPARTIECTVACDSLGTGPAYTPAAFNSPAWDSSNPSDWPRELATFDGGDLTDVDAWITGPGVASISKVEAVAA